MPRPNEYVTALRLPHVAQAAERWLGDAVTDDALARMLWSHMAIPGTSEVGALIREHGAFGALTAIPAPLAERLRTLGAASRLAAGMTSARHAGLALIVPSAEAWPEQLGALGDTAPICLYVRGDIDAIAAGGEVIYSGAGADSTYPRWDIDRHDRVVAGGGAVVSELPPGAPITRWNLNAAERIANAMATGRPPVFKA